MTEAIPPEPINIPADLIEAGELCGCTELQVRFAACLLEGNTLVEAAWRAGYKGARDSVQLRSAGSSTARSKPVQALLALAESRGLGIPSAPGDADELRRILWSHARSKDRAASIKASAELKRIDREEDAERRRLARENTPESAAAEILKNCPEYGPIILADAYIQSAKTLFGLPFLAQLAPLLRRDFPRAWERYRSKICAPSHLAEFDAMAAGPVMPIDRIIAGVVHDPKDFEAAETPAEPMENETSTL